ncbi:MAG: DNA mismatch endonuclease Vsr [Dehalococcoidia bacterium]|nr:DNA mismatch endonuclease Vsr [Dehalococcoidia bacterium]
MTSFRETRNSWLQTMDSLLTLEPVTHLKAIDLFCGAGGLSLGFRACGFDVSGVDWCADAVETYSSNVGNAECVDLFASPSLKTADLVIAGPPCQPWSRAGKRKGAQDERDGLSVILEAVRFIQPAAVVVENVPDLARKGHREYLDVFENQLTDLDYLVGEHILNAADFGVPQNRRRIFVTGVRGNKILKDPQAWSRPVPVRRAIPGTFWRQVREARPVSQRMSAYIERYERASGCRIPRDLHLDQPSRTLTVRNLSGATGDMVRLRLPDGTRRTLTIREAARLQSFPDWFQFKGSKRSQFEQVGNAVPPLLAMAVAETLREVMEHGSNSMRNQFENGYPIPSSAAISATMRANKRKDTSPERRLRSALHRQGRRFRVDMPLKLPGRRVRPDIVFPRRRVAVFVDGCFWHACPEHGQQPRSNVAYWAPKLQRNQARDKADDDALRHAGWIVVRVWEHDPVDRALTIVNAALERVGNE